MLLNAIAALMLVLSGPVGYSTHDTIRSIRAKAPSQTEAYSDVSLACPNIELPSVTGNKAAFRYIDAGCEPSLTIRPTFGVSGGVITGYKVYSIPYAPPFPFNTGTPIFIDLDDIWGDVVPLPFKFCFYENTYKEAVVGANGLISFNTSVANKHSAWSLEGKSNIPSTSFKGSDGYNWGNAIYGVFEDIDPNRIKTQHTGGSIRYGILGTYPCRTLTVSWYKVPNFSCYSDKKYWDSFQIVLYEGTNVIDVYVDHKSRCASWNLGRGIIGIQNQSCTKGIAAPHRNTTDSWTADREAWRFAPVSNPQYMITYYDGMGVNGAVLGTGEQITIDPTVTTAITARLQFTAANGERFDLRDTAVIVHTEIEPVVINKVMCENSSYYWRGTTYTQPGIYTENVGEYGGCIDKIYTLNLTVDPSTGTKEYHSICEGDAYFWMGKNYQTAGTYFNRSKTSNNCEIIDTLVLTVNRKYSFVERDTICEGESYSWHNRSYTTSGSYQVAHTTGAGCDSVYELKLIVGKKTYTEQKAVVCEGQAYKWRGRLYKEAGMYYDSLISPLGCDSVLALNLKIADNYKIDEYDTICNGETYQWHGKSYSEAGVYYDNLKSVNGCDSIHVLHLSVNKTYLFIEENGLRTGGTYRWRNKLYTSPGQYYDSLKTINGCDSVYQLNLTYIRSQLYTHTHYMCEGDEYTWRRKKYNTTGVYYDSLKNVNDADSVYQLNLIVGKPLFFEDSVTICEGETYEWFGETYSEAGVYDTTVVLSETDCGSTYTLKLFVGKPFHDIANANLCTGSSYHWRDFTYSKPGVYYDEYKTVLGCDSIYELNLRSCKTYYFPTVKTTCKNDPFLWRGKQYSEAGVYWDSLKTVSGCDSIYRLELKVEQPFVDEEYITICDNEKYDWREGVYSEAGTYYDSLHTRNGCDSVYILHLSTNPTYYIEDYATICEGQTYEWHGNSYNQTDTYYDAHSTTKGCDSVYVLHLTTLPTYYRKEKDYICSGEQYMWEGEVYTQPGVYTKTFQASLGHCDSIVELTLGVADKFYQEEEYSTCDGTVYSWHDQEISKAGVYWDSLFSVYGCDSVYKLTISYHPIHHYVTKDTICQGESYAWRDSVYAIDSVYYDQYATIYECDSLYELQLTVLPTYYVPEVIHFCEGDEVTWHNRIFTKPGLYYDSLTTSSSCDSVIALTLIEHPKYHFHFYDTINEGSSYSWQDISYEEEGEYDVNLTTPYGCDSILTLHLTVHPRFDFLTKDTICMGEEYSWQGNTYTESGEYTASYQTVYGNDSIYTLQLEVKPVYFMPEKRYLCQGDSYQWRNKEILTQGMYYDSLKTSFGCDSVYSLEMIEAPVYTTVLYDTICAGESFAFEGHRYTDPGQYSVTYVSSLGCDSTYKLFLHQRPFPTPVMPISDVCADDDYIYIICEPSIDFPIKYQILFNELTISNGFINQDGYIQNNQVAIPIPLGTDTYVTPNTYGGVLTLTSEYCKEQHDYEFAVNILYPSSIVVQKFNDVLAVLNDKYNGGHTFSHYQWYADGAPVPDTDMPYFYGNGELPASYYQVLLTRSSDGVTMMTCPIEPRTQKIEDAPSVDIHVYPTIVDKQSPIVYIRGTEACRAVLYNAEGVCVQNTQIENQRVMVPSMEGVYLLVLIDHNGYARSYKIIVH